jgi:hypothetical protein
MNENSQPPISLSNFLYPRYPYRGHFTPEELLFNANLQEFAQRIGYISSLQTSGKISTEDAYEQVRNLWEQLKEAKKELNIGQIQS